MANDTAIENDRIRNGIIGMYKEFVETVEINDVTDLMIQHQVLLPQFVMRLRSGDKTRPERCRMLLDEMLTSGNPESFCVLKAALEEHGGYYSHVVDRINGASGQQQTRDSSRQSVPPARRPPPPVAAKQVDVKKLQEEKQQLESQVTQMSHQKETLQKKVQDYEKQIDKLDKLSQELKEASENNELKERKLLSEKNVLQADFDLKKREIDKITKEKEQEIRHLEQQYRRKLDEKEKQFELLESRHKKEMEEIKTTKETIDSLRVSEGRLQRQVKQLDEELKKTKNELQAAKTSESNSSTQLLETQTSEAELKKLLRDKERELEELTSRSKTIQNDLERQTKSLRDKTNELDRKEIEINELKEKRLNEQIREMDKQSETKTELNDAQLNEYKQKLQEAEVRLKEMSAALESTRESEKLLQDNVKQLEYQLAKEKEQEIRDLEQQYRRKLDEKEKQFELLESRHKKEMEELKAIKDSIDRQQNDKKQGPQRESGIRVKVMYDYTSRDVDELSLKDGEILTDVSLVDEGWATGTNQQGKTGMFPINFCADLRTGQTMTASIYSKTNGDTYESLNLSTEREDDDVLYDDIGSPKIYENQPQLPDTDISTFGDYEVPVTSSNARPGLPRMTSEPRLRAPAAVTYNQQMSYPGGRAKTKPGGASQQMKIYKQCKTTFAVSDGRSAVSGLTVLNGVLYVVRENSANVFVYSTGDPKRPLPPIKLQQKGSGPSRMVRMLTVAPGHTINPSDIASCVNNNCLYVSERSNNTVIVVTIASPKTAAKSAECRSWPVDGRPYSLSVTRTSSNVLVCFPIEQRLNEYSNDGKLIHRINLPPAIVQPWRGIEVGDRQWVVCHGGTDKRQLQPQTQHRVCLIDGGQKQVTACHGSKPGPEVDQLDEPLFIVADANNNILVADCRNNRVKLLNDKLEYCQDILTANEIELPRRLYLCTQTGCLYVGLRNGKVIGCQVLQSV